MEEHHMARGVAWGMQYFQGFITHRYRVAVFQPAIRREHFRRREPEHLRLHGQALNPEVVVLMGPLNRQPGRLGQLCRAAGMVDVGVGKQDFLQSDALGFHRCPNAIQVAARVHHRRLVGFGTPEQGAVLFKGSDGNHAVLQGHNLPRVVNFPASLPRREQVSH